MTQTLPFKRENHLNFFFNKFINILMKDGKKTKASRLLFDVLTEIKKSLQKDASFSQNPVSSNLSLLHLVFRAFENIKPVLQVRKVRRGRNTVNVPAVLSKNQQETLAFKWLVEAAKKRQENSKAPFSKCLADEILDASRKTGFARQKRDELHRLAQQSRGNMRYRWW